MVFGAQQGQVDEPAVVGEVSFGHVVGVARGPGAEHLGQDVLHAHILEDARVGLLAEQLEGLDAAGANDVRLSFNVSPKQFASGTMGAWVTVLRQYAAEQPELMKRLELEVTESTVMACADTARGLLEEFKSLGIRIAMDDFGTGHSSLAQLKGMPLDVLKLDRSLIQDIDDDERSLTLVRHLANMASDLNLEVIAEGVETDSQVQLCKEIGCDLIQGFAFYKPLEVDDFFRVLRSERHGRH